MNVWIDGVVFDTGPHYGIRRVFFETLSRLAGRADLTLWLRAPAAAPLPRSVRVVADRGRNYGPRYDVIGRLRRYWARAHPPRGLRQADLFHTSYFTRCPVSGPVSVVSVYDMVAERMFPVCGDWAIQSIAEKRAAILSAALCVCISLATADDLVRFYPQVAGRIRVIPLGAEHLAGASQTPAPPADAAGGEPFALFVGHRYQYKNFPLVLDALCHPAWPRGLAVHVVGPAFAEHEQLLVNALGLEGRVRYLGRLSDDELRVQFHAARCFLFPSLLEGFGLPVLEAQVSGCPAVLSDIPVFHEVAGDGALFFDPRRGEKLAEAVAAVTEPDVRRRLLEAGHKNATRFSWDHCADQTLAVYEEAVRLARR
jgi:glycosyltransferase involved in cell wall biosynthesis